MNISSDHLSLVGIFAPGINKRTCSRKRNPLTPDSLLLRRWCSRVGVPRFTTGRFLGGWRSGRWDGLGPQLRPGLSGHDFRYRQRQRRRRRWRRFLCGCRREHERGIGLERRPQHRGAQASRLGRLATVQSTATAARTTSVYPRHGVQSCLSRRRLNRLFDVRLHGG